MSKMRVADDWKRRFLAYSTRKQLTVRTRTGAAKATLSHSADKHEIDPSYFEAAAPEAGAPQAALDREGRRWAA